MTGQRRCDGIINGNNQDIANGRAWRAQAHPNYHRGYDRVRHTAIKSVRETQDGGHEIEFVALGANANQGTDGNQYVYGPYKWLDERLIWAACPSTLPAEEVTPVTGQNPGMTGKPPNVRASGSLYLARDQLISKSYGQSPARPTIAYDSRSYATPKWPASLPLDDRPDKPLRIFLKKLELRGTELESGSFPSTVVIDLLDRTRVPAQTLELGEGAFEIQLKELGRKALKVSPGNNPLSVLPAQLVMCAVAYGIPDPDEANFDLVNYYKPISGPYRIEDLRETPAIQNLELPEDPKSQTTIIRLTDAGFDAFGLPFPV